MYIDINIYNLTKSFPQIVLEQTINIVEIYSSRKAKDIITTKWSFLLKRRILI